MAPVFISGLRVTRSMMDRHELLARFPAECDGASLHAELDFKPDEGEVRLKEATARHRADPRWWLRSDTRLGLDDPFIRMRRDTENYPLIGNAFWRDESLALWYELRVGDRDGRPVPADGAGDASGALGFARNPGAGAPDNVDNNELLVQLRVDF